MKKEIHIIYIYFSLRKKFRRREKEKENVKN